MKRADDMGTDNKRSLFQINTACPRTENDLFICAIVSQSFSAASFLAFIIYVYILCMLFSVFCASVLACCMKPVWQCNIIMSCITHLTLYLLFCYYSACRLCLISCIDYILCYGDYVTPLDYFWCIYSCY